MPSEPVDSDVSAPVRLNVGLEEKGIKEGVSLYVHEDGDIVSECIRKFQSWEMTETRFVLDTLKPGDVALDIGANIGYYTTLFGKLVGPEGRVIAFEPNDDNFALLIRNVSLNQLRNIELMKAVVSDRAGIATLSEFTGESANHGAHMAIETGGPEFAIKTIHPQIALDDLMRAGLDRVDFIKMDTQGSEPLIFRGGKDLIQSNARHLNLVVEFTPEWIERVISATPRDYYNQLLDYGFAGYYFDPRDGSLKQIEDIDILIDLVMRNDGVSWPRHVSFVDLVFKPRG